MTTKAKQDSLIWGVILIVIGLIFFLDNINFNVWRAVARFWPVVLIAWGAWKLYYGIKDTRKKRYES
ncbi:MAG: DUF5668 domain-containing protein [Candidatus Aminicenantes bacterium]